MPGGFRSSALCEWGRAGASSGVLRLEGGLGIRDRSVPERPRRQGRFGATRQAGKPASRQAGKPASRHGPPLSGPAPGRRRRPRADRALHALRARVALTGRLAGRRRRQRSASGALRRHLPLSHSAQACTRSCTDCRSHARMSARALPAGTRASAPRCPVFGSSRQAQPRRRRGLRGGEWPPRHAGSVGPRAASKPTRWPTCGLWSPRDRDTPRLST